MKAPIGAVVLAILAACTTPQPSQETEAQRLIRQQHRTLPTSQPCNLKKPTNV